MGNLDKIITAMSQQFHDISIVGQWNGQPQTGGTEITVTGTGVGLSPRLASIKAQFIVSLQQTFGGTMNCEEKVIDDNTVQFIMV